ncbi:MAG: 2'-5' RNA ligase family protein [Cyclobacterium sp.]|uniref:2'-5' RNA ligase family protein n=1 Tax=Cyclobacterium sp. TaxID=1966343 RepID=UPI003970C03E
MPKKMGKYFIALVPEEPLRQEISHLKHLLKEEFGVKYALKSPPHITLKMPFVYNENKESVLEAKLESFFLEESGFDLSLSGIGHFGNRVVYLRVKYPPDLPALQQRLVRYGKRTLGQHIELSDLNYHPHLTLAFKDIKKDHFDMLIEFLKSKVSRYHMAVETVSLLKKTDSHWIIKNNFNLLK